jgi:hypothetical protein
MESRALGRTDNRDCLGAWYDIVTGPPGRARTATRWWRRR